MRADKDSTFSEIQLVSINVSQCCSQSKALAFLIGECAPLLASSGRKALGGLIIIIMLQLLLQKTQNLLAISAGQLNISQSEYDYSL